MAVAVASPPIGVSNGELVRWSFSILNERDVEPLRRLWTDDILERFPSGTVRGADAMAEYFQTLFAALPDVHIRVVAIAETGEDVFVHWHLTGTHTGAPFEGIDPTGRALGLLPPQDSRADRATKVAFNAKTRLLSRLRRRRAH